MSSNLADLPLDLPPDLPPSVLTSSGQDEFKFGRSILHYWHLVVKMKINLAYLPTILTSRCQDEFKFGRCTPRSAGRSTPQYWYLVVKMSSNLADLSPKYCHLVDKMSSNLADLPLDLPPDPPSLVLTSSGQDEFKFGISTPRSATRSILPYWHLVVKMSSILAYLPSSTDT